MSQEIQAKVNEQFKIAIGILVILVLILSVASIVLYQAHQTTDDNYAKYQSALSQIASDETKIQGLITERNQLLSENQASNTEIGNLNQQIFDLSNKITDLQIQVQQLQAQLTQIPHYTLVTATLATNGPGSNPVAGIFSSTSATLTVLRLPVGSNANPVTVQIILPTGISFTIQIVYYPQFGSINACTVNSVFTPTGSTQNANFAC